ncbi:hypothetical protein A1O7_06282 [Cladophialophora yegresii CBS 114405]|uniref:PH domain-containing protein n=1 Tax=Cladophialophora yegresii CBS 114405 TaxID=1182544 RepID=W9VT27_9EURO|nr:uncharacterized protein A1O7_06282 [Cladophialophora yegresii CBS 114405]EXJ58852.1 hypothetical protein A1O7_06282 [Cladophialophora yegresii CBS 114405]
MSVEAPKTNEETPFVEAPKALPAQPEATSAPTDTTLPAPAEPVETVETTPAVTEEPVVAAAAHTEEPKKDEAAVDIVPASEGVLGYKEPTFFKKFIFTKHYFWLQEEPSTAESLTNFLRSEKADTKHSDAAWARETGNGLLFYSKRAEDKATPAGIINLTDASAVTKEGFNQFSFKAGAHQHRFEATTSKERDSWVLAVEKIIEDTKGLKEEISGRDSYKKNLEEYSKPALGSATAAVKTPRSKSKEPKKSVDAATAAEAAATTSDTEEVAKPNTTERSESRKRGSIFGSLLGGKKDGAAAEKKEEKAEAKKEIKEEKKAEAAEKKEEAKETKETGKAVEAAEAAAVAAVPAAATSDKKEEKEDASPVEKKGKRGSVFGSLFKNRVTSPTAEKSEKEAVATSDVPPVSETAPKLEEPIENKPIDTAAVTAPVDTAATPLAAEEATKEPTAAETTAAPKTDKKGGLLGFIKKTDTKPAGKKDVKEETKEEKAGEAIAQDPVAAASAEPAEPVSAHHAVTTEPSTETSAPATEERPVRDNKRRTSLFFNKKQQPEAAEAGDTVAEPKREKSPLPGGKFIGQLVRRASKAIKSDGASKEKTPAETAAPATASSTEAPTTTSETPAAVPDTTEPTPAAEPLAAEPFHSTPEPVATTVPEVKATA